MKNEVRYHSLVKNNNKEIPQLFAKNLKINNVRVENTDLVIPKNSFPSKDFVLISEKMNLFTNSLDKISLSIFNSVPKSLKDNLDNLIKSKQPKLVIDPHFGRLAKLYEIKSKLFCNISDYHLQILKEEVLPFMIGTEENRINFENLNAKFQNQYLHNSSFYTTRKIYNFSTNSQRDIYHPNDRYLKN